MQCYLAVGAANLLFIIVCLCGALMATLWAINLTRYQVRRFGVIWRHESALREAIAEWRDRHPERVAELQQLRDKLDD